MMLTVTGYRSSAYTSQPLRQFLVGFKGAVDEENKLVKLVIPKSIYIQKPLPLSELMTRLNRTFQEMPKPILGSKELYAQDPDNPFAFVQIAPGYRPEYFYREATPYFLKPGQARLGGRWLPKKPSHPYKLPLYTVHYLRPVLQDGFPISEIIREDEFGSTVEVIQSAPYFKYFITFDSTGRIYRATQMSHQEQSRFLDQEEAQTALPYLLDWAVRKNKQILRPSPFGNIKIM